MKISIELSDLRRLLEEQTLITAQQILRNSGCWQLDDNKIEPDEFLGSASGSPYPKDVTILLKYMD